MVAGILVVPATGQAATCPKPGTISVRQSTLGTVKVSWKPKAAVRKAGSSFRVLRGNGVVGQTRKRSMVVRAKPGARITIKVGVVGPAGRAPRCYTARRVRIAMPATLPAPRGLGAQAIDAKSVMLSWRPVAGARAYRVVRDGHAVGQTKHTRLRASVAAEGSFTFTVATVGLRDRVGKPSKGLHVDVSAAGPGKPSQLSAPIVTTTGARLTWTAAKPGTAPIRAYRVFRDGQVVGQFSGTQADIGGLVRDRQYALAVASVDTRGRLSAPTSLTVRTQLPAATRGHLHAFMLASTDDSFRDLQQHYDLVGTVYPTYFDCSTVDITAIKGQDDPLVTQWVRDRRIKIQPRFNCQRPAALRAIFTNPAARAQLIRNLVDVAVSNDYDGINLDFEAGAPQDRDSLTAFVADLAAALHGAGRLLSLDVSAKFADDLTHPRSAFFDYAMLSRYADSIFVMSWGLHWSTSASGPTAPADWLTKIFDYVAEQPNKQKFFIGQPLYGFDWPAGGGPANRGTALSYDGIQALIARWGAQPTLDPVAQEMTFTYTDDKGVHHEVWYVDGPTLNARYEKALARGLGGVGVWRLGQEDPGFWSQPTVAP
jgi:spore germination protein YaaH